MSDYIEHEGIVVSLEGKRATVRIIQQSACAGCHAKSACTAADRADKEIDAQLGDAATFEVGEQVLLRGSNRIGMEAVLLAFVIPFLLIIGLLILFSTMEMEDGVSGAMALGVLIPYYGLLYAMRERLTKRFVFEVFKKIEK